MRFTFDIFSIAIAISRAGFVTLLMGYFTLGVMVWRKHYLWYVLAYIVAMVITVL